VIITDIANRLIEAEKVVIASHYNPEGDAIGAILALALALEKMGKKTCPYNRDGVPFNLKFMPEAHRVKTELPGWMPDTVVIADCGDFSRVGDVEKALRQAPTIINIDHHETNSKFGHFNWVLPEMASTGEMIAEVIDALKTQWTPDIATCIYTAIVADTGSFQFGNTSPNSFRVAARMIEYGANPAKVARYLFFDLPEGNVRLLARVLATMKIEAGGKMATVEISRKMFEETGTGPDATEGLVDYPRSVRGIDVAVLFRETGNAEYKISMRSKGNIDVAAVARSFGGGGHAAAAGCTIKGSLNEVRANLIEKLGRLIGEAAGG